MKQSVLNRTRMMLAAVAVVVTGSMLPVFAGGALAPKLIDKPFEECLIRHFQTRFFNRIDATKEQRQKLADIFAERSDETRPMREELRQGLLELNELMAQKDTSDQQIIDKAHQLRELRNKMMDERLKSVLMVRDVLTQGQRELISSRISGLISGQWNHHLIDAQ